MARALSSTRAASASMRRSKRSAAFSPPKISAGMLQIARRAILPPSLPASSPVSAMAMMRPRWSSSSSRWRGVTGTAAPSIRRSPCGEMAAEG